MRGIFVRLLISSTFMAAMSFSAAFAQCNARIVTTIASFTLGADDCAIGVKRDAGSSLHQRLKLPSYPHNGQIVHVEDLIGDFRQHPIYVIPNTGQRIADVTIADVTGETELNTDGAAYSFRFYSTGTTTGIWSFSKQ